MHQPCIFVAFPQHCGVLIHQYLCLQPCQRAEGRCRRQPADLALTVPQPGQSWAELPCPQPEQGELLIP